MIYTLVALVIFFGLQIKMDATILASLWSNELLGNQVSNM